MGGLPDGANRYILTKSQMLVPEELLATDSRTKLEITKLFKSTNVVPEERLELSSLAAAGFESTVYTIPPLRQ